MTKNAFIVILTSAFLAASCRTRAQDRPADQAVPVRLVPVVHRDITVPVRASGIVAPKTQINLAFKTGGIIGRIFVDEGRTVEKGALLAELDSTEIEAYTRQAKEAYEKAERDLTRAENLYQDKAAPLEIFENAGTAMEVAKANLSAARFNLDNTRILAPAPGRILKRLAEERETVGPGMPVLVLASTGSAWVVRAGLTDKDIARLRIGDQARLKIDALGDGFIDGAVTLLADVPQPMTGTYEAEISLSGKIAGRLRAGYFVQAEIIPSDLTPAALIPAGALVEGDGRRGIVFTIDRETHRAVRKEVGILAVLDDGLAVSGLEGTADLVADGAADVSDGVLVRDVSEIP